MSRMQLLIFMMPLFFTACSTAVNDRGTIGQLRDMHVEIEEEKIEGGLEKAMESYQRFLEETSDSALTPEAIRRLADLKVEEEYGLLTGGEKSEGRAQVAALPAPEPASIPKISSKEGPSAQPIVPLPGLDESEAEFERRASMNALGSAMGTLPVPIALMALTWTLVLGCAGESASTMCRCFAHGP